MRNEDLVLRYQKTTDETERRQLIEKLYMKNLPIIKKICCRYAWNDDLEDLMQEAYFGIVKAAGRWNPDGGAAFIGYAAEWIKYVIKQYLNQGGRPVRLPRYIADLVARYQIYIREYEVRTGSQPSDFELLTQLDITAAQLEDIRNAMEMLRPRSTSEPIPETDGLTLEDVIADPEDPTEKVIDELHHAQLTELLRAAIDDLAPDQATVIRKRYFEGKTLAAIGAEVGLSQERIRQKESVALRKLRSGKHRKDLDAFVEDIAHHYAYHASGVGTFRKTWTSAVELAVLKMEESNDYKKRFTNGQEYEEGTDHDRAQAPPQAEAATGTGTS